MLCLQHTFHLICLLFIIESESLVHGCNFPGQSKDNSGKENNVNSDSAAPDNNSVVQQCLIAMMSLLAIVTSTN